MRSFIFILLFVTVYSGFSQTSNKKRILIIPFNRMEFDIEYSLEDIAAENNIEKTDVYENYKNKLVKTFENFSAENFEFVPVNPSIYRPLKKYVKYAHKKFNKKKFYASNLELFPDDEFTKLMEAHNTDFVLFVNWYHLRQEVYIVLTGNKPRLDYAGHYIDYDVYNLFKQKLFGAGRVQAKCPAPNKENIKHKLLRLNELEAGYKHLATHIIEQLNKPIEVK